MRAIVHAHSRDVEFERSIHVKHESIQDVQATEDDAEAQVVEADADRIEVSVDGSCVVLSIARVANGARAPVTLSAAASRALAAELMSAADALEPST